MAKGFLVNSPHAANTQDRLSQSRVYEPPKTHPLQGRQNKCETSKTKQIGNVCGVIIAAPFAFLELSQTCCVTLFFSFDVYQSRAIFKFTIYLRRHEVAKENKTHEEEEEQQRGGGEERSTDK